MKYKTNTARHAEIELDVLAATAPNAIITQFRNEILALCEKFGSSGQSGGSAPFTATALAHAVKTLCLGEPICDITGDESEWIDVVGLDPDVAPNVMYQNKRDSRVFKMGDLFYFVDAIVFKNQHGGAFTNGRGTSLADGSKIGSLQKIKSFPFKPKTFYIDVIDTEVEKDWWESKVKDEGQLKKVWKYFDRMPDSFFEQREQQREQRSKDRQKNNEQENCDQNYCPPPDLSIE